MGVPFFLLFNIMNIGQNLQIELIKVNRIN